MIVVNKEDCIRCGACQGACPTAAIEVSPEDVIYCDVCGGAPKCVDICPRGALKTEELSIDESGVTQARVAYNPSLCDECGDCVEICPPQVLKLDEGKMSKVPLEGYCVMCQKCVDICPVEVIGVEGVKEPKVVDIDISGPIAIVDCVGCGMCVDECPVDAITLDEIGGSIVIDEDTCIKCGVCSQTCPWNAVYISGKKPEKRAKEMLEFTVDEDTCIGCNVCVEACPGDFIIPKASTLSVELPEVCTACGLCEQLCPVDAINLEVELGPAKPASEEGLVWEEEKCDHIGACARICPTDAIRVVTNTGMEVPGDIQTGAEASFAMCTRCGACTTACPEGNHGTSNCPDGTIITGHGTDSAGVEDDPCLFMSTTGDRANNGWESGSPFPLVGAFVVSGDRAATFVVDFRGQIQDAGGECGIQPPVFGFR